MSELTIYVDADSVPVPIRAIILRRARKEALPILFVADRPLKDVQLAKEEDTAELRRSAKAQGVTDPEILRAIKTKIDQVVVPVSDGSADDYLVAHVVLPLLAITHDIPLADRLVEKGAVVLDDRGHRYDGANIKERLSLRDTNTQLRELGVMNEKTKRLDATQIRLFSDCLDRTLTTLKKTL